jgi:large subunit ribosomal protein L9
MKVILKKDVPRLGVKGDVLDVSDAYAINVLLKNASAEIATPQLIAKINKEKAQKEEDKNRTKNVYEYALKDLEKSEIIFKRKVDDKGHLYAKVNNVEIADEIFKKIKLSVDPKQISFEPVHTLGDFVAEMKNNGKLYKLKISIQKI